MVGFVSFSRMNALIVEDQSFIRTVVSRILKQLDFNNIWEAEEGTAGLDIALERRPDVIICDIEMEPMDGLTFLQQLRQKEELGRRTPVIFLTNHAQKDIVLKARDLGVNAFIAKPVTVIGLRDKLAVLLGVRR
ncbi:response regulator [Niveispirillum sp. SYP-B3756]|uniref:response regulator n=2 Tax=Rhodospirillales TaxID=204441 RepID=UPI000B7307AE|nr:response regulator [Niveispirillum sp. SYP-B3756]MQP67183.1 response regulator [Niveispirillum sp. SYP-B3756]SNS34620.1 two-component system, chemotaxis family, response regulator CheY [Azospirillum sp. RU38E]SNS53027.1 two-component system, chemotaxis family, response regulator CheY [Azospirillum sp. RU37A]